MMNTMNTLMFLNTLLLSGGGGAIGSRASTLLETVGTVGGALVGIALIISIVKDAMGYIKGSGSNSIGKIIGKVLLLIVMIGIIAVAQSGGFSGLGKNAANKAQQVTEDVVQGI